MAIKNLPNFLRDFYKEDSEGRTQADKHMSKLTLAQLNKLIDLELKGRKSQTVLRRLHRRLCRVRAAAERANLAKAKTNWRE